jgi:hypothetical protein
MTSTKNRRPGANWHGGEQIRKDLGKSNVVSLAPPRNGSPLDEITLIVALDQLKRGTLRPQVLEWIFAGAGVHR